MASYKNKINTCMYSLFGKKPWSRGYSVAHKEFIHKNINDVKLLRSVYLQKQLTNHYGYSLDERVIEYPWCIAHLGDLGEGAKILDAGSTFNFEHILDHSSVQSKDLTIFTLAPEEHCYWNRKISYDFGDLRNTPYKDELYDAIFSISVVEHIGMDNTQLYTSNAEFNESRCDSYLDAIKEMKRILKPGGSLFVTVPFGKYENYGYFQQFDASMINKLVDTFAPSSHTESYYKYSADGWQICVQSDCSDLEYFDVHTSKGFDDDYAAAARGVACIKLVK